MNRTPRRFSGKNIKLAMDTQGRRNDWLAERVGVSVYKVTRWLNSESLLSEEDARSVAGELGIPFVLLFESHNWDCEDSSKGITVAITT